jgi:hypothetical protein
MIVPSTIDPIAAQMAQLVLSSDGDELREIVRRWVQTAGTASERRAYERFGAQLLDLRDELSRRPIQPTRDELQTALTLMLTLARQSDGQRPNQR